MSLKACRIMTLPKIHDPTGNLSFVESSLQIPFDLQRVYYLYDVPGGAKRGGHAHKKLEQFLIAISGSFDVVLQDDSKSQTYHLNRPYLGLYISPMIWRKLENFSSGAVCLVLASAPYDEADYIRDHSSYLKAAQPDAHEIKTDLKYS